MDSIEKSLESKSQSISDWWNSVPSLDKLGVSGTLLIRLSDAVNEVKNAKEEERAKFSVEVPKDLGKKTFYAINEKDKKRYIVVCYTDAEFILRKAVTQAIEEERLLCNKNFKEGREELLKDNKEVEVRVREKMVDRFKLFLKKHEVMFFGCDCSDCQTMEDDFEEKFLIKTGVQKE